MNNGVIISLFMLFLIAIAHCSQIENSMKFRLKKTGKTNSEILERLDYLQSIDANKKPSYLQLKFPANEYPYVADPEYPMDTEDTVHVLMRDILENGFTSIISIGSNRQEFY